MKKSMYTLSAATLACAMLVAGCGSKGEETPETNAPESVAETEATQETEASEEVVSVAEINYTNVNYDFAENIAKEKAETSLVPEAANVAIKAEGVATGTMLVASVDPEKTTDLYLNTFVAGEAITISASEGTIASASSSVAGEIEVADGKISVTPAAINLKEKTDEIITVTMEDGTAYNIHTAHELLPGFEITGEGVSEGNDGVYAFAIDKFMLRVNTEGELVYYRNLNCVGAEKMAENFQRQETKDGAYHTAFIELRPEYRNSNGGYSSGMYLVMDENYVDKECITLVPNDEANHTHGEGYLDQHEFLVLDEGHYLTLSYTPELIENLPEGIEGIDGGSSAYVWAGVFQELVDGKVIKEINTTDYPMLYESAIEKIDYANSTDQGVDVEQRNGGMIHVIADGFMDYVHVNSLDYTLDAQGNTDKLLVSMRDQCAVYQFDLDTGAMEWILGGKASTLTGFEEYTTTRKDDMGTEFTALTYAQHYARYCNKNEDGTLEGNAIVSIFDNQTGAAPFLMMIDPPTLTRVFKAEIDMAANTATITDVINGKDLDAKTGKYHNASHCGSVDYFNNNSVLIGWGLHAVVDAIGPMAPEGTIADPVAQFKDLRQGSRPIFSEYDMENDTIAFELSVTRNPLIQSHEALFSYRTYKTAE